MQANTGTNFGCYEIVVTGEPFDDAYRYVGWLLAVPLLLFEWLCVMDLPADKFSPRGVFLFFRCGRDSCTTDPISHLTERMELMRRREKMVSDLTSSLDRAFVAH